MKAVVPAIDPATGHAQDVLLEVWAAQQELPYFVKVSFLSQVNSHLYIQKSGSVKTKTLFFVCGLRLGITLFRFVIYNHP